ncbi:hypothetical protein PF007_g30719 [Phytophthora fragariae]|uniref:Secreted protein n=1 Tax=Phytophthora fragariae TaxID=53985 RepID=A0A6A3PGT1_9STRA|nr:hypothetical protein PF003_g17306 [Phytophthora fragariae]KAE9060101.1 hypothetical protein PF007_g30719 [Phytophthora fragariae]
MLVLCGFCLFNAFKRAAYYNVVTFGRNCNVEVLPPCPQIPPTLNLTQIDSLHAVWAQSTPVWFLPHTHTY